jgi:hypothetical protein
MLEPIHDLGAGGSLLMSIIQPPLTPLLTNAAHADAPEAQNGSPLAQMGTIPVPVAIL